MKRIRTIDGVIGELRQEDPRCAITAYALRSLIKRGAIPFSTSGKKYLLAVEDVIKYYEKGGD